MRSHTILSDQIKIRVLFNSHARGLTGMYENCMRVE